MNKSTSFYPIFKLSKYNDAELNLRRNKIMTLHIFCGLSEVKRESEAEKFALENEYSLIKSKDVEEELKNKLGKEVIAKNEIYEEIARQAKKFIRKGQSVVVDATNLLGKQRRELKRKSGAGEAICYFIVDTFENMKAESHYDEETVLRKYMTANVPFKSEGWDDVKYIMDPLTEEQIEKITSEFESKTSQYEDPAQKFAALFMLTGKKYFDRLPEGDLKKIGFNNMSAQIAFHAMLSSGARLSLIEEVVTLILYKKRIRIKDEKGLLTIKSQLGEKMLGKLMELVES
jgi:predicted kinase